MNSYKNWEKQEIQVLKGSKAYKLRVPIFYKIKKTIIEEGKPREEEKKMISFFKHGNSFDISQTSEYAEIDYEIAMNFVKENFPEVEITEDFKHQEKKVNVMEWYAKKIVEE